MLPDWINNPALPREGPTGARAVRNRGFLRRGGE